MKVLIAGSSPEAFKKYEEFSQNEVVFVTPEDKVCFDAKDTTQILTSSELYSVDFNLKEAKIRKIATDKDSVIPFDYLVVCDFDNRANLLKTQLNSSSIANTEILNSNYTAVRKASYILPDEVNSLKGLGFLWDKRTPDKFNGRIITRNGKITSDEAIAIAEAAQKFGSGEIAMTTRQTIEIQGVAYENIRPLCDYLKKFDLYPGGTGPKVRPVVSCKGTTCRFGLIDTFALSMRIHEEFYVKLHETKLPHKFKIAVGGCPNNCVKPDINDLGIVGQRIIDVNTDDCKNCKTCQIEKGCPMNAAKVVDGKITIDKDICNNCARCLGTCPFGLFENYKTGYKVFLGGRWGKKTAMGKPLSRILKSEDEVINVIAKAIELFSENGNSGERFGTVVERLGIENVEKKLFEE